MENGCIALSKLFRASEHLIANDSILGKSDALQPPYVSRKFHDKRLLDWILWHQVI